MPESDRCTSCGGPRNHFVDGVLHKKCAKCNDYSVYVGLRFGCPVCGYGVDWQWWPDWYALLGGTVLFYVPIDDRRGWYEYLCRSCMQWASQNDAMQDRERPEERVKIVFDGHRFLKEPIDAAFL